MVFVKTGPRGKIRRGTGFLTEKLQTHAYRQAVKGVHQADGESQIANLPGVKMIEER